MDGVFSFFNGYFCFFVYGWMCHSAGIREEVKPVKKTYEKRIKKALRLAAGWLRPPVEEPWMMEEYLKDLEFIEETICERRSFKGR